MKLPYHRFHRDYQPDDYQPWLSTVTINLNAHSNGCGKDGDQLIAGNVDINKLRQTEEGFKSVKPEKIANKIATLTVKEKSFGYSRCRSLKFPNYFSSFSGDVFTNPVVTLKITHGWTKVFFSFFIFLFCRTIILCFE